MDFSALLTTVLAVTTVVAAALAGLSLGLIQTLRNNAEALQHRVDLQEKKIAEQKAEIAEVKGENEVLRRIATGEVDWTALTDLLTEHHSESMVAWVEIRQAIREATTKLERPR